ncbi:MAG: T4SS-associated protein EirA, partial [Coxiellaceae bacterium]|nr:T4SS-associated protein EirA [Coxiellaceae bacterium]
SAASTTATPPASEQDNATASTPTASAQQPESPTTDTGTATPDQSSAPKSDANAANPPNNTTVPHDGQRVNATQVLEKIVCPSIFDLSKNGLFWGAPNGWRSYSQSFVNEIVAFVEAQWHGVNVGKMMCVYIGKDKRSFPVVLQNDMLTDMPSGYGWGTYDEGVIRCKNSSQENCPFFHKVSNVDIEKAYDSLDFKKGQKELD